MKRACIFLLSIFALIYGYEGYKSLNKYIQDEVKIKTAGRLSDISNQVLPVPLETPDSGVICQVKRVQTDGNHLFLLSDKRLLQFDKSGAFTRQIATEVTNRNHSFIADYTLDTDLHQIIAIDSQRNLLRYDYSGKLLATTNIKHPWYKLTAFAYHDGYLWATAESLVKNNESKDGFQVMHCLYQLDTEMNEITRQPLQIADVGRDMIFQPRLADELLADEDGVYAYMSPVDMNHLLDDTLYIMQCRQIPGMQDSDRFGQACIYPVRKGRRFFMSTNHLAVDNHYTYCYDTSNHTAYMLQDGFRDDLFHTGYVTNLQPMDMYNQTYCFLKSGADIVNLFPDRTTHNDGPVLFIITLNA